LKYPQQRNAGNQPINLEEYFVPGETFQQGLISLTNQNGDFSFTFKSDISLDTAPDELKKQIEIYRKVQYAILRKFKQLKMFQQRGTMCIQNTSLGVDKEAYHFCHVEKSRVRDSNHTSMRTEK
jgi:hypothetical protein